MTVNPIEVAVYEAGLRAAYAAGHYDGVQQAKTAAFEATCGWPVLDHDLEVLRAAIDELGQSPSR